MKPANQSHQFLSPHTSAISQATLMPGIPTLARCCRTMLHSLLSTNLLSSRQSLHGTPARITPSQPCPACPPGSPVGRSKKQQYLNAKLDPTVSHFLLLLAHRHFFPACTQNQKDVVSEQRDSSLQHQVLLKPLTILFSPVQNQCSLQYPKRKTHSVNPPVIIKAGWRME